MKYTENEMKEILSQKLELSNQAEERLQETYSQIRMENKTKTIHAKKSWRHCGSRCSCPCSDRNRRNGCCRLSVRAYGFSAGHVRKYHETVPGSGSGSCRP